MNKVIWVFLLVFLASSSSTAAVLSLESYLKAIKSDDLKVKAILLEKIKTKYNEDLNLQDQSWSLDVTNTYGFSNESDTDTERFDATLSKSFVSTGTQISLRFENNELEDREEKVQSIELEQSLARNFFGQGARYSIQRSNIQNKVTHWQVEEAFEDYLEERITAYLDYLLAYENFQLLRQKLQDSRTLLKEVRARFKKSIARQVDVDRILVEVLDFQSQVLEAESEFETAEKKLMSGINSQVGLQKQATLQIPYYDFQFDFDSELTQFNKISRTTHIMNHQIEEQKISVSLLKRALWPEFKLLLGMSKDDSSRFGTPVDRHETYFGFSLNYKFDDSLGKARRDQATYELNQVSRDVLFQKQSLKVLFSSLKHQIEFQRKRYQYVSEKLKVLQRLYRGELERYRRGRLELKTLIETQNRLSQARNEIIQQRITIAKLIVQWKSFTDKLLN